MEYLVCDRSQLKEKEPYFITLEEKTIGVTLINDQIYAIENRCPHFEGPVCLGDITGRVRMHLNEEKQAVGDYALSEYVSENEMNMVCPWHGLEFDVASGVCTSDNRFKLKKFTTTVKQNKVYIDL